MIPEGGTENSLPAKAVEWAETNSQEAIPPEAWTAIGAPSLLSLQVKTSQQVLMMSWCDCSMLEKDDHMAPKWQNHSFHPFSTILMVRG